jgi:ubiquinone/menaquinone biosynthesis C-methylase UbiE
MRLRAYPQKVDLEWDDKDVVPPIVYPDTVFYFHRVNEVALDAVAVEERDRILDIGCGRAYDAAQLTKRGGDCLGLEPSGVMLNHAKVCLAENNAEVALVQGIGEELPFKGHFFDKVICKGSLDHFLNPSKVIEEISRVLKSDGKAMICVANFESLGFRIGRSLYSVMRAWFKVRKTKRKAWEPPSDHLYKFDYPSLKQVVEPYLKIEESMGVSLLYGLPGWDRLIDILPESVSSAVLNTLDKLARHLPSLGDVIVLKCSPRSED